MATPLTPRRGTTGRRRGRPPGSTNAARAARLAATDSVKSVRSVKAAASEPPPKRRKYVPGGPGGGGRFIDVDGTVTHVVRGPSSSSTRNSVGNSPSIRGGRGGGSVRGRSASSMLPRREKSTRTRIAVSRYEPDDEEQFSSAAAVAAAVAQSEGYKPREERGWEEFHPNLDIETTFMVFRSEEVDGTAAKLERAKLANPANPTAIASTMASFSSSSFSLSTNPASSFSTAGAEAAAESASSVTFFTGGSTANPTDNNADTNTNTNTNTNTAPAQEPPTTTADLPETPLRRRIGRPPRDGVVVSYGYGGTGHTPKTPKVLPIHNQTPKEKLDLKLPSYRRTDRILLFENKTLNRYVDKSMMNVGYQETDVYIRPDRFLLKASDANAEEEVDAYHTAAAEAAAEAAASGVSLDDVGGPDPLPTSYGVPGSAANFIISGGGAGSNGGVGRVEYDMDEQDDMWLAKHNVQRKAQDVEPITREIFEITITKIEKEWHLLEKRIPKPNPKPPQTHRARSSSAAAVNGEMQIGEEQDSKCAICDDGDCENTNAIVFCDGCDLAVHQDCYGVPFIPEGQWLCRKCQLIGRGVPTCIFCPNTDGAFKQTNSSKWAHMLCAMWIPETSLGNTTFMEPVMDVDKVPKTRWRLTCYICRQKMGACIQCGNKACYQAFHVTCARRARLYLKMKNSQGALAVLDNSMILKAFCDRHCPPEYAKENAVHQATREAKRHYKRTMRGRIWADSRASALQMAATTHGMIGAGHAAAESQMTGARIAAAAAAAAAAASLGAPGAGSLSVAGSDAGAAGAVEASSALSSSALALTDKIKNASAAKPMWKLPSGAPVIPQAVFDIVETALQRFMLRRRREFVSEACRYWTLKREARRGAALLKRLQLQMETFTSMELTRRNFATMGASGQARLERRIEFAQGLIRDLEQLRSLANDVVERESDKLEAATLEHDFVNSCYFPVYKLLAPVIAKASTYDKGVFSQRFAVLQDKLNTRFYTTTLSFAHDLADIVQQTINQTQVDGDVPADNAAASSYTEPRDRKRLGKRILKSIQPMLEAAVRAEADITRVPLEPLQKELEQLLEACVELAPKQKPAATQAGPEDVVMADGEAPQSGESGESNKNVSTETATTEALTKEAEAEAEGIDDKMDVDDAKDDALTTPRASRHKTISIQITTPRSSTLLVNGANGVVDAAKPTDTHGAGSNENGNGKEKETETETEKEKENEAGEENQTEKDQAAASKLAATDAPLTPPQSHNGSLPSNNNSNGNSNSNSDGNTSSDKAHPLVDTLDTGGVLWYLHGISPKGTTVADELLCDGNSAGKTNGNSTGNSTGDGTATPLDGTASRLLSEDLTDMDDEELKGLEFDVEDSTITAAPSSTGKKPASSSQNLTVTTPRRGRAGASLRKGVRTSSRRR